MRQLFLAVDLDGSDTIDQDEYVKIVTEQIPTLERHASAMFRALKPKGHNVNFFGILCSPSNCDVHLYRFYARCVPSGVRRRIKRSTQESEASRAAAAYDCSLRQMLPALPEPRVMSAVEKLTNEQVPPVMLGMTHVYLCLHRGKKY